MERLPDVTPSLGLAAVDARIICTRDSSISSSSAAICASAVTMPCPISTWPGEIVTCPVLENFSHDDSFGFAARLGGSAGGEGAGTGWLILPPFLPPRAARRAPCDYVNRSGRGCGRGLPLPPAGR